MIDFLHRSCSSCVYHHLLGTTIILSTPEYVVKSDLACLSEFKAKKQMIMQDNFRSDNLRYRGARYV